jgi:hypothetical protein
MSNQNLKSLAMACKILAVAVWVLAPWILGSYYHHTIYDIHDIGYIFENVILAVLSLVPNRWLVSSKVALGISSLAALIPVCTLFLADNLFFSGIGDLFILAVVLGFLLPLPLSILFSYLRFRRGEKFTFA